MFLSIILFFILIQTTDTNSLKTIVFQIKGDCQILADKIAHEHGYRYVRQVCFVLFFIFEEILFFFL